MRVLFDTNVVLDVLLEREPHFEVAAKLFALVDNGRMDGCICATTATTIFYVAAKSFGSRRAREQVRGLIGLFEIAPVGRDVLAAALDVDSADYEDAVLAEAGRAVGATVIVTRDQDGFGNSSVPVLNPVELLAVVAAE